MAGEKMSITDEQIAEIETEALHAVSSEWTASVSGNYVQALISRLRAAEAELTKAKDGWKRCIDLAAKEGLARNQVECDLKFLAEYIWLDSLGHPMPNYLAIGRFPLDVAKNAMLSGREICQKAIDAAMTGEKP